MIDIAIGLGLTMGGAASAPVNLAPAFNTGWTLPAGYTAPDANTLVATNVALNSQPTITGLTSGVGVYQFVYDLVVTSGSVAGEAGFAFGSPVRTTSGHYTDTVTSSAGGTVGFQARVASSNFTITNATITKIS